MFGFTEVKLGILPAVISPYVLREDRRLRRARAVPDRRALLRGARARDRARPRGRAGSRARCRGRTSDHGGPDVGSERGRRGQGADPGCRWRAARRTSSASRPAAIAAQRVSPEGQEGMRAFLEKRKPGWSAMTFRRVLIANRGEIAVRDHPRLPRGGDRERRRLLGRRRARRHVSAADRAVRIGPAARRELPVDRRADRGRAESRAPTPCIPATGSSPRTRAFAAGLRGRRPRLRRAAGRGDRADGIEDRGARADAARRRAGRPGQTPADQI